MLVNHELSRDAFFRFLPTFRVGVLCQQPIENAVYWLMRLFPPARLSSISPLTP